MPAPPDRLILDALPDDARWRYVRLWRESPGQVRLRLTCPARGIAVSYAGRPVRDLTVTTDWLIPAAGGWERIEAMYLVEVFGMEEDSLLSPPYLRLFPTLGPPGPAAAGSRPTRALPRPDGPMTPPRRARALSGRCRVRCYM